MPVLAVFLILVYLVVSCVLLILLKERTAYRVKEKSANNDYGWLVFVTVFTVHLAVGYYMAHISQTLMVDAAARVANAFYVLHIYPPHLASIGFVWPPLPSFLQLPFLLFWPIYQPIAASGLSGVIVTAFFTAATAFVLYRNFKHFRVPDRVSIFMLFLYSVNPFIFVYGFNGMSEAIFIFALVWAVCEVARWIEDESPIHLIWIAVALCIGFFTRYEVLPFAIAVCLAILIIAFKRSRSKKSWRFTFGYFETAEKVPFGGP